MSRRCCWLALFSLVGGQACGETPRPPAATAATRESSPAHSSILVTEALGHPHIGDLAPDFELPDQNGNLVKLSSLRGSVVMLALVSSWCPYSQAEQPHLKQLAETYAPRGVKTVAVVIADTEDGYKKYTSRLALPFPVLRDVRDEVALGYAPEHAQPSFKDRRKVAVTSNLVIDKAGVIRHFALVDTVQFDADLTQVRGALDKLLASGS
jgi:peroxiredoxin